MKGELTIGALAKRTGVTVETIRFYERIGVLPVAGRTANGYRRYADEQVRRLVFIRRARDLGFSLGTVRALLDLSGQPERSCAEANDLVAAQLAEVDRKIADLERLRDELARLGSRCGGRTVAECRIIQALSP